MDYNNRIIYFLLGFMFAFQYGLTGQNIIADTVRNEILPGKSMAVYSRREVNLEPGFFATEGSVFEAGTIDSIYINTNGVDEMFQYKLSGFGIYQDSIMPVNNVFAYCPGYFYNSRTINIDLTDTLNEINKNIQFTIDTNYVISKVGYINANNAFIPLSELYYNIKFPNYLSIYSAENSNQSSQISVSGLDKLLLVSGQSLEFSGLSGFLSYEINIYNIDDYEHSVRTLTNFSVWDGKDSLGNICSPGVYLTEVDIDNYGENFNFKLYFIIE